MPRWQVSMTSAMLVAIAALKKVRESPTLMGMVGSRGAMPPASKRIVRVGAWVRWASMAAAQGTPVPTATVRPSSRARAAQQIMSSIELYADMKRSHSGDVVGPECLQVGQFQLDR